ncbi:MAG: hypothetical protein M1829_001128 [Trizodia sp. TS-e1964]|nr:MAG: hypothetical protein M1829_001128 [Trizodia sp. TS-e1964]
MAMGGRGRGRGLILNCISDAFPFRKASTLSAREFGGRADAVSTRHSLGRSAFGGPGALFAHLPISVKSPRIDGEPEFPRPLQRVLLLKRVRSTMEMMGNKWEKTGKRCKKAGKKVGIRAPMQGEGQNLIFEFPANARLRGTRLVGRNGG